MIKKILNRIISRWKGSSYVIDEETPDTYLLRLCLAKSFALFYGKFRLHTFKRVFVDPSAKIICSSKIHFEEGLNIGYQCYINALSKKGLFLGKNVSMGFHTHIELSGSLHNLAEKMIVGDNVGLGSHGHFGVGVGSLIIGNDTIFGNYVSIHPENHIFVDPKKTIRSQGVISRGGVKIGCNCWVGAKATFLDGAEIGDGCIVAAGAVVNKKFPGNCIIAGVPAKIVKIRNLDSGEWMTISKGKT